MDDWNPFNNARRIVLKRYYMESDQYNHVDRNGSSNKEFEVRLCRQHTIPANAQVLAYNSTLVGNYTIASGWILSLYGSAITGTLTKNGTLNLYQPASQTKNDSTVSGTTVKDALKTLKAADMPAPTALSDVLVAAGSPLVWTKVSL